MHCTKTAHGSAFGCMDIGNSSKSSEILACRSVFGIEDKIRSLGEVAVMRVALTLS
jgi:hypothetical protein